jgi:hypothetical protein
VDELIKTNNPVTLSFVEALLRDAVDVAHLMRARQLLRDAGLEKELDCSQDD